MELVYFAYIESKEDAKAHYKNLCKIYHPDAGTEPDNEIMADINVEYEYFLRKLETDLEEATSKVKQEAEEQRKNIKNIQKNKKKAIKIKMSKSTEEQIYEGGRQFAGGLGSLVFENIFAKVKSKYF